ncbi:MAG: alpha/beta hydrolase [Clostridium sp.]|nr:alpha/beta hydrolase [Acetatifactor muris]MCM1526940.1 alpha/beta hydrolase [Bacteroides sp.]MCM1563266.1 alpha/beta hydrolase [Clostridium sp.]
MKFYEFGDAHDPAILLLPGTCCHWKANFGAVIPLLEQDFRVICASYDGFDETEDSVFPDMLEETARIESYIRDKYEGRIMAAYGCSLGGSFVGLLAQRRKIHIDHGILGSSDLDQGAGPAAKFQAWLISRVFHGVFQKGRLPGFMRAKLAKMPEEEQRYYHKMMDMFGMNDTRMAFVKRESIRNQFYSDLVTPLEDGIFVPDTTIHIFYAVKMGEQYLERYERHFKNPDIRRHELQHEELLICRPKQWAEEVRKCCGVSVP